MSEHLGFYTLLDQMRSTYQVGTRAPEDGQRLVSRLDAALVNIASTESGQIFLEWLIATHVLPVVKDPFDCGKQALAKDILYSLREAIGRQSRKDTNGA